MAICSVRPRLAVHKRTLEDLFWFTEPGIVPRDGHIFVVPAKANISTIVKTDLDGLMFGHGEEPVTPTRELVSLVSGLATPLREVVPPYQKLPSRENQRKDLMS